MRIRHGESRTRLYRTWQDLKRRCYDPNRRDYKHYGLRGIIVCDEWKDNFLEFKKWALSNGYDDSLTIERINVDGNYSPDNCKWIPFKAQGSNKTNNFYVEYNGERKTIAEWSRILHIHENTLTHRIIDLGWSIDEAFCTKPKGRSNVYRVFGSELTLAEMSKKYGKSLKLLWKRIHNYGWTPEDAVSRPVNKVE